MQSQKEWSQQNRAEKIATDLFSNREQHYKQVATDTDNNISLQHRAI